MSTAQIQAINLVLLSAWLFFLFLEAHDILYLPMDKLIDPGRSITMEQVNHWKSENQRDHPDVAFRKTKANRNTLFSSLLSIEDQ